MEVIKIPPQQQQILEALAQYKFLTVSQMLKLGISTDRSNLQKQIKALTEIKRQYIEGLSFGIVPKKGKLENVYYLKPKGQRLLIEGLQYQDNEIKLPKGRNSFFSRDYFHRKYSIDFEIALQQSAESAGDEVVFFDRYFDKQGNNRRDKNLEAKTKIILKNDRYLVADGIFMLSTPKGERLHCFELYNGKDTKRIYGQLRQYLEALELGSPSTKHNHPKGFLILSVFEYESILQSTLQRIQENSGFSKVRPFYFFKSLQSVVKDGAYTDWINGEGEMKKLY